MTPPVSRDEQSNGVHHTLEIPDESSASTETVNQENAGEDSQEGRAAGHAASGHYLGGPLDEDPGLPMTQLSSDEVPLAHHLAGRAKTLQKRSSARRGLVIGSRIAAVRQSSAVPLPLNSNGKRTINHDEGDGDDNVGPANKPQTRAQKKLRRS